jgi:hypothetical protein
VIIQTGSCGHERKLQLKHNQAGTEARRLRKESLGKVFAVLPGYLSANLEYDNGGKEQKFGEIQITSETIRFKAGSHVFNPSRRETIAPASKWSAPFREFIQ